MNNGQLTLYWQEVYEERAAIIEEGCKVSRMVAEGMARMQIEKLMEDDS